MAPPTATETYIQTENQPPSHKQTGNGTDQPNGEATHEPKLNGTGSQKEAKMQKFPAPPKFTDKYEEREYLKGRLALAFRIFGKLGFDEGVAGHITLRDPVDPTTFWVNPFGLAFSLIKKSDLILVNHDGVVIDGGKNRLLNQAAYMIHAAVHAARPDVTCAAHSHSIYGRAFCSLGRPIDIITQDACAFYNDLAVYNSFKGVVLAKEEGENIAKAIGNKKACLLQNHGLLTTGATVEAALVRLIFFPLLTTSIQSPLPRISH